MLKYSLPIGAIVVLSFLPTILKAQSKQTDVDFLQQSTASAIKSYHDLVSVQKHLYTGTEYAVVKKNYVKGHQFFLDELPQQGSILYDGAWFENVPLQFDLAMDEVVAIQGGNMYKVKLVKQKIKAFNIGGYAFTHIKHDSTGTIAPGFYNVLFDGKASFLAKRAKVLQEKATTTGMEGEYRFIDKYYIYKDGAYHQVKSKGSVLRVFREDKKQLSKFLRDNNIKFSGNREDAILSIVQHYESL
ncbi:hypothetical protein [Pontibacter burrus]|uniref:Uncharacterized protein n=1 Tax=Pontibacter burrus TaxID=2704466 RepID=A0A6B3LTV1_9BACT|nr:hypothetical protein [Pontibacter burrus]NEM96997.1 hypothetical protein [Pontibacter burrus]